MTPSALNISGVDFVTVMTKDFPAATDFYENVLDLPRVAQYGQDFGAEFETGNLTLQLLDCTKLGLDFRPTTPIALHVDDFEGARAELEARGVEFTHGFDSGVCHQAIFSDPDGNTLALHHRYAPKAQ